jgi:high-affinity iron transporter
LGWTNSATYGSVISYNLYWIFVMVMFIAMRFHEMKGHWPLRKPKMTTGNLAFVDDSDSGRKGVSGNKAVVEEKTATA